MSALPFIGVTAVDEPPNETPKLAAMLVADIVGYYRLAGSGRSRSCGRYGAIFRPSDPGRIATRYDMLVRNLFSALCFVSTLAYWL